MAIAGRTEKKTRTRAPKYFMASIVGSSGPTLIIAMTKEKAVCAVVTMSAATTADVLAAGRHGFTVIDTLNAPLFPSVPAVA